MFDLRHGSVITETLPVRGLEFPSHDKRYTGMPTSRLFGLTRTPALARDAFGHNCVVSLDRSSQRADRYEYDAFTLAEEHVFVPGLQTLDSGGWLVGTSYNWKNNRTSINVFNADDVSSGPVAVATLPYALPLGLHGHFTPS